MADTKISALTVATTPLAGTEVLPIVQSGVTKQVSVANLTAGRAVSADSLTLTGSPLPATSGGTGQSSYAVGDLLYASTTTALSKLADVAIGNALISGGVGVAPSWGKIGLTTHVSGVLPVANGGTNASSASITAFNNITGYTATGATGTTSTNLVFSGSPTITTPILNGTSAIGATVRGGNNAAFISYDNLSTGAAWLVGPLNSTNSFEWQNATSSTYLMSLGATSGNLGLDIGNLVIETAGKGIDFSANSHAAGMTSELLNWYEEGTFTPVIADAASGGNVATISAAGRYTRIGRQVTITFTADSINTTGLTAGNSVYFRNFPFTSNASGYNTGSFYSYRVGGGAGQSASVVLPPSSTAARIFIYTGVSLTTDTPLKVSDLVSSTSSIYFTLTYFV